VKGDSRKLPKMAGYTIAAGAVFLVGVVVTRFLPGSILGALEDIGVLALSVSGVYYLARLYRWLREQLLWKVRNRIIVSFAFVGIIPLVLLLLISTTVLFIVFKRLSGFYLERELEAITETLDRTGTEIAFAQLKERQPSSSTALAHVQRGLESIPLGLRHAVATLYEKTKTTGIRPVAVLPAEAQPLGSVSGLPDWIKDGFRGLTSDGKVVEFTTVTDLEPDLRLVLQIPFDDRTVEYFSRRTSLELVLTASTPRDNPEQFQDAYARVTTGGDFFRVNGVHFFRPVNWETGAPENLWSVALSVPMAVLLEHFFARETDSLVTVVVVLLFNFLLVEIISFFIGATIARRITVAIHELYSAVLRVQKGDFDVEIPARGRDQLDNVARSFNEMSSSIKHLMMEVSRREALEKELEIAKEVQTQLFPQQLPTTRRLSIAASCTPARQVSGDYFDFLSWGSSRLDIVVGDISGKGISAALLMASLQATIRSGLGEMNGDIDPKQRMARVARVANRQLYRRSSPESYSTLVLGHFDAETMKFYYCNAGHHPPLLFSRNRLSSLTVGGTVIGLFENWNFESAEVPLEEGDLLLFFTDGVVEAPDRDGEQYGTERLIETVRSNLFLTAEDIQTLIVDQVFEWSAGVEQADDITVVCVKVT